MTVGLFTRGEPQPSAPSVPLPSSRRRPSVRSLLARTALYVAVALVAFVVAFPIYWMMVTSVRPTRFTISYPPAFWPEEVRWAAYLELFQNIPITLWIRNTALVAGGVALVCLVLSIVGAYALSSFQWRGRTVFGFLLLTTQMLPEGLVVIPIFIIFRVTGLLDSLQSLILSDAAFAVPVTVWVLKGFFDTIPREIQEAALVDGCSRLSVLWRIMLPLSLPALATVALIAFFEGWNEYLFASTFITSSELRVATAGLAGFIGELATPLELVFAAAVLFCIPPLVFFLLMQRYIVSGLTRGAIKG